MTVTTLGQVCEHITDGKHGDCLDEPGSGYYFVSCKDVSDGRIFYAGARQICRADFEDTHRRTRLAPGDLLITNSGTIGRMAIAPNSETTHRTTFQKSVAILKPRCGQVDSRYLYYSLHADLPRLVGSALGTAQKNLLLRDLRAFAICLPDLAEQRRIAGILGAYDDLIENCQRRIKILEEMARSLYREWFVHHRYPGHESVPMVETPTGSLPEGWTWRQLGELVQEVRDGVPKGELSEATPFVGLEHIPRRSLALDDWDLTSELGSNKLSFRKGDILFGKIRAYFHKVAVAPFDGICSADTIVLRSRRREFAGLAIAVASSDQFVAEAAAASNGSKMPRANWTTMRVHLVPVPPEDQLTAFQAGFMPMIELQQALVKQVKNLQKTRDLLLPRLLGPAHNA